eukprot:1934583-Prymnesium_polylepis.1
MGDSKARWATARPDGRQQGPMPPGAHACNHGPTGQLVRRHVPGPWPGAVSPFCRSYWSARTSHGGLLREGG